MKKYYLYIISALVLCSCTDFTENLNSTFLSAKEAKTMDFNTSFPVINIEVDQNEFDEMYANIDEEIEIEGSFNLYRNNELLIKNEKIEIEIKGGISANFNLKSLGIKFEDSFNNKNNELLNPSKVLPNHSLEKIKAVRLRNSGNDFSKTLIKDISYTQLAIDADLDLEVMYYEPAIVFINNSFSGVMNLRSEANRNGMYRLNKADKDDITLAKVVDLGEVEKKDGNFEKIDRFIEAIETKNLSYLKSEVDLSNFTDYIIFQTYIANVDWPFNNVRFYAIKDKPFRFVLFDLDWVNIRKIENQPLVFIESPTKYGTSEIVENPITDLFKILYADDDFKNNFEKRYTELINNGSLSFDKFNKILSQNFNMIKEYMPLHIEKNPEINTMIEWYRNIDLLKDNFKEREKNIEAMESLF